MKLGLREIQFPQIWGDSEERYRCKFQWERNLISLRNKSMWQFPWIWGAEWAPSDFEGVFRHFVMNLSDFFWLQTRVNAHGRDNQSFPTSLVPKKWLYLASTFFAPALRGSPHSSQNQIQIQITNLMMRRAGLSMVGSLAQSTIGLTSKQSYQTLQVVVAALLQSRPFKVMRLTGRCWERCLALERGWEQGWGGWGGK